MKQFFKTQQGYIKEYERKQIVLSSYPRIENIELTSHCNLRCLSCLPRTARKPSHMDISLLAHLLQENKEVLEGQAVWMHFNGETLLYPYLYEALEAFRQYKVIPRLSTNATLLSEEKSRLLIEGGLSEIVFSIDGAIKETYEMARRGADFHAVIENVNNFIEISKGYVSRPNIQVQIVESDLTMAEIPDFISYWTKKDIDSVSVKRCSNRAGNIIRYPTDSGIGKSSGTRPCFWLWRAIIVLENGDIVPCCTDMKGELVVGNIKEQTILGIWNSEQMQSLRKAHITNNHAFSLCNRCDDRHDPYEKTGEYNEQRFYDPRHRFIVGGK